MKNERTSRSEIRKYNHKKKIQPWQFIYIQKNYNSKNRNTQSHERIKSQSSQWNNEQAEGN